MFSFTNLNVLFLGIIKNRRGLPFESTKIDMAKLSYQSLLMKLRKWNEFFNEFRSPNYSTVTKRIDSNLAYYSLNYLIFLIFAFVLNGFLAPKMFIWLVLLAAIGAYVFYVQYFGVEVKMGDFTIDKTVLNIIYSIGFIILISLK
ncbi:hypothetical protein MHBO_003777 [Bonamia ostreae]|uniref:PRA1 family protein n=1 Tax=Bonamia ostreae TaxID=126728 RepID=A0ABV2ARU9_9EUKA